MEFQGRFFRVIKNIVLMHKRFVYKAPDRSDFIEPAVYVCRHSDNKGPVVSMANLPMPVHPWSYSVWCDAEECYKQCVNYTFSVRYGWGEFRTKLVARLIAKPFSALIRSAGAIPVYRNSLKVRETFKESVEALKRGESLLIFPDVDYTSQGGDAGALYEGFLMLERLYYKEVGSHLPFVPMHISEKEKRLVLGDTISFREGVSFKEDKDRVIQALHDTLNDMMENHGT